MPTRSSLDYSARRPSTDSVAFGADWQPHRQRLLDYHEIDTQLRRLPQKQSTLEAEAESLELMLKDSLSSARGAAAQSQHQISRLTRQLNQLLDTIPARTTPLVRQLDQNHQKLQAKNEALDRLRNDVSERERALEALERAGADQRLASGSIARPKTAPAHTQHTHQQWLREARNHLLKLEREIETAARNLPDNLSHEIGRKAALAGLFDAPTRRALGHAISHTLIKHAVQSALEHTLNTDHEAPPPAVDLEQWVIELLTRPTPKPWGTWQIALGLAGLVAAIVGILAIGIQRHRQSLIDITPERQQAFLENHAQWWAEACFIMKHLQDHDLANKSMSWGVRIVFANALRDIGNAHGLCAEDDCMQILIPGRLWDEGTPVTPESLNTALAFRRTLWEQRPWDTRAGVQGDFERHLKHMYSVLLDSLKKSYAILDNHGQPGSQTPVPWAILISGAIAAILTLAFAGLRHTNNRTHTQLERARKQARQVARFGHAQTSPIRYRPAAKHTSSPLGALDQNPSAQTLRRALQHVASLAADPDTGVEQILTALKHASRSSIELTQHAEREQANKPHATLAARIEQARRELATRQQSLSRKQAEANRLDSSIAKVIDDLQSSIDTPHIDHLVAKIAGHNQLLQARRQQEQALREEYEHASAMLNERRESLRKRAQTLSESLAAAETNPALNATRDRIKTLATPNALSMAMERHVGLPLEALESRLRHGRMTPLHGLEITTAQVEFASTYHSAHALHLALIDAIEKAPREHLPAGGLTPHFSIVHPVEIGTTTSLDANDNLHSRTTRESRVSYHLNSRGQLRVSHIFPA